ncbi:hypothetical protein, conserved [Eimeria acervulina]|uniref:Transmembrane protein n=1 Tax=Eimeria acervulina TaxID=5801 RepID=U6GMV3_EIMAC|nr:hypothetical protein, conserved [Eimeria acervulina]CDI80917.1 hypothetical protein, conserved [Eimeria acervulina]
MQENDSSCSRQSSACGTVLGSSVASDASNDVKNSLPLVNQQSISLVGPPVESLDDTSPAELLVAASNCDVKAASTDYEPHLSQIDGPCDAEDESLTPFDKRPSYLQISRRLQSIRTLPALVACFSSLIITSAICGAEMAIRAVDIYSSLALLCSSVIACMLAIIAAHKKSHVLLVGLVMLEVLFTLYSIAFASVGLVNVTRLRKRQQSLQENETMQAEQLENALKISRRMLIEQAIFAGLYFIIAVAHCCAAASVNHLRATVRPFDSRLRRKRQRARAMKKLNVLPPPKQEGTKGAGYQESKAGNSPVDLQLVHYSRESQTEEPPSHSLQSDEAGDGTERQSVRNTASSLVTSSSSSGTSNHQTIAENSAETLEAQDIS